MSPKEKKLLLVFGTLGFIILNLVLFNFYKAKHLDVIRQRDLARNELQAAEMIQASREQVTDQMDWLAEHDPEPAANQDVQTKLQALAEREAKSNGLAIKNQKPLPTDAPEGAYFNRAKLEITVIGTEESLYRWFDRLNSPEELRTATRIRLSPNTTDDTKIDCTATVDQWFIPLPPA